MYTQEREINLDGNIEKTNANYYAGSLDLSTPRTRAHTLTEEFDTLQKDNHYSCCGTKLLDGQSIIVFF